MPWCHRYILVVMHKQVLSFYEYVLLHKKMFHKKCFMKKCFLSECPGLKHGFWFATCLANLSAQTLLLQRGNMFQNWWQNSLRDFFDVCICKCTRFPDGNLLFLSLFSLSKNWMHNVGWGCALVLVKKSELSDIPKLQNFVTSSCSISYNWDDSSRNGLKGLHPSTLIFSKLIRLIYLYMWLSNKQKFTQTKTKSQGNEL